MDLFAKVGRHFCFCPNRIHSDLKKIYRLFYNQMENFKIPYTSREQRFIEGKSMYEATNLKIIVHTSQRIGCSWFKLLPQKLIVIFHKRYTLKCETRKYPSLIRLTLNKKLKKYFGSFFSLPIAVLPDSSSSPSCY